MIDLGRAGSFLSFQSQLLCALPAPQRALLARKAATPCVPSASPQPSVTAPSIITLAEILFFTYLLLPLSSSSQPAGTFTSEHILSSPIPAQPPAPQNATTVHQARNAVHVGQLCILSRTKFQGRGQAPALAEHKIQL